MIQLKINNPPLGISENQLFLDEDHLNEWLQTHADKLPGFNIEGNELFYDFHANIEKTADPGIEWRRIKLPSSTKFSNPVKKETSQKVSIWFKIITFVKTMLRLN